MGESGLFQAQRLAARPGAYLQGGKDARLRGGERWRVPGGTGLHHDPSGNGGKPGEPSRKACIPHVSSSARLLADSARTPGQRAGERAGGGTWRAKQGGRNRAGGTWRGKHGRRNRAGGTWPAEHGRRNTWVRNTAVPSRGRGRVGEQPKVEHPP